MLDAFEVGREDLYERVWSEPVIKVGGEYGITGTALSKISEAKAHVEVVTCRKPTAQVAEERAATYARRWVDAVVQRGGSTGRCSACGVKLTVRRYGTVQSHRTTGGVPCSGSYERPAP